MSSIQKVPVEILLDVFRADDPADMDALQLTCRRFNATILKNVDALPMRLVYHLVYGQDDKLRLYRAPADKESALDGRGREARELIASGNPSADAVRDFYQDFGRKTAIRKVEVWAQYNR